ncbi:MAG: S41 family peptidase [bacterium]
MITFNFNNFITNLKGGRIDRKAVSVGLIIAAIIVAFLAGKHSGAQSFADGVANNLPADTTVTTDAQFSSFWKVWHLLDQKYVAAGSTTAQQKVYGAIQGLAASEGDPYTVFFPPAPNAQFQSDIAGNFQGVGMEIDVKNNTLTVVAPLKGSPSEKAGVKTGDIILKINGTSTQDMATDKAVSLIRGPKGTTVTLNILRQGGSASSTGAVAPMDITIVRDIINIPTLDTSTRGTGSSQIFIISLYSFTADSPNLFRAALRDFVASGDHKLVLDLRGNPGGYLEAAWDMASWFLPAGDIVVTEDYGAKAPPDIFRSKGYNIFAGKGLQMEILVNGGSASAAEILAGALSQHGVAKLVGTKTFGKGSVQELVPITADTSLKVTIARWLTPNGTNLSHNGIEPDVIVPVTDADITAKNDVQLGKALQLLNEQP